MNPVFNSKYGETLLRPEDMSQVRSLPLLASVYSHGGLMSETLYTHPISRLATCSITQY